MDELERELDSELDIEIETLEINVVAGGLWTTFLERFCQWAEDQDLILNNTEWTKDDNVIYFKFSDRFCLSTVEYFVDNIDLFDIESLAQWNLRHDLDFTASWNRLSGTLELLRNLRD